MIDIHCHLLPGVDDGAADLAVALNMARGAVEDGIGRCVVTPHWTGRPDGGVLVRSAVEELGRELRSAGISLAISPGNEVVLVPRLLEALRAGQALTLANSSYVLLETAQLEREAFGEAALFQLQASGYRIILAHPERVRKWQKNLAELAPLVERGCLVQVNAGSFRGGFGAAARKTAEELVRRGWASFLASDGHSADVRPLLLQAAFERCAELAGERAARLLVDENPARVLCDERVPEIEVRTEERRSWFSFARWR